jgi:biopolymer transport protein ExbD/biopolymer transport protein TolR
MSDINVTNLVDVVLVLLIVFMISAPLLQSGVDVDLPKTSYVDEQISEGIVVTVKFVQDTTAIYLGTSQGKEVFVNPQYFGDELDELLNATGRGTPVYLRADKNINWQLMVDIISSIKEQGVADLGIVTAPYEENLRRQAE